MKLGTKTYLGALENIIWPIVFIVYGIFCILNADAMLSVRMIKDIAYSAIPLGFIVLAEAIVLLNGNFDLSVGQIAGLSAAVGAIFAANDLVPPAFTPFVPIIVGTLCGCVNGILVGKIGLNAFLATLGTFLVFDGIQLLTRHTVIFEFPEIYLVPGEIWYVSILIFVCALGCLHIFLYKTKYGYHYLAVGSSQKASGMLGLPITKIIFLSFVLSGLISGISGLFYTGYLGAYGPLIAEDTVFMAFAAAVLGGISLKGGRGKIINVFGGVILLGIISSGLTVLAVSPYVRRVLFGVLVVTAIIIDLMKNRIREKVMKEN
jgi:ribose/xylose/arabinose/galactoside ABC-type transport system permease subunit